MKRAISSLVLIFTAMLLVAVQTDAQGPKIPAFELRSLDGKLYTDQDLTGHPTLLVFWASWCTVCQGELPKIHDLQERMKRSGFQVIAVGFADTEANIRGYVKSHPLVFNFPVLYDADDRVAGRFGAHSTPTLFLLNSKGELVIPYRGGGLLETPQFKTELRRLLS